jgi:hypothetical protein
VSTVFSSRRVAPVAAVALGALTLGLGLTTVPLDILTDAVAHQVGPGGPAADWVSTAALMAPPVAVATLLAVRRPGNPIGWILLAIFLVAFAPVGDYAVLDYRIDLPRAFRTADLLLIHAADCRSRYSSWTCCGVRY